METRDAILRAARTSFIEQGIDHTRLASVARSAYVAPSTVSLHFGNKEGLFAACVDRDVLDLQRKARAILDGHPYPALSGDLLRVLLTSIDQYPLLATILVQAPGRWSNRFYGSQAIKQEYVAFADEVRHAQQAGLVRHDIDAAVFGKAIAETMLSALWTLSLQHGDPSIPVETTFAIMAAALFYPVERANTILERSAPWRSAHRELGIDFGITAIPTGVRPTGHQA